MNATIQDDRNLGVAILDRVFAPDDASLTAAAARSLLLLKFSSEDERRMNRLAAKARRGTLTDREQFQAEQFNLVSHMLALLQAKAQQALRHDSKDLASS